MTRQQQKHLHAILTEIARDRRVSRGAAKAFMLAQFRYDCQDAGLAPLWAGVESTRQFPSALASAFCDYLYSWQANAIQK